MTPDRWSRINAIFGEALDLAAAERESHVAQACGGDTELRDEILDLLAYVMAKGEAKDKAFVGGDHKHGHGK